MSPSAQYASAAADAVKPLDRARIALPLALLLGLVAPDGFAPLGLWALTLAALAGLALLAGRAQTLARAFGLGWWFGLGMFCVGLNWIATAFTFQAAMPAWLGWIAVVLLSLYLAIFSGIGIAAGWWLWRRTRRQGGVELALALAACWAVSEYLRATVFTGFAWNPVAAIWAPVPLLAPATLPWIGTYGLSGLTMLIAALIAWGMASRIASRRHRTRIAPDRWTIAILLALAFPLALALAAGARPDPTPAGNAPLVRIIQPNIPQDEKWEEGATERNFARIAALTGRPGPEPRLVLWPETTVPWYIQQDGPARAAIAGLLGPRDLMLLGAVNVRYDAAENPVAATNSVYALRADGRLVGGRYDKSHLVPYGEYLPMRPLLSAIGISRLAPGGIDFDYGPGPRNLAVPGIGPVGIQVCYEITFSGQVVDPAHRPRFLFNPSNDGWFGSWGPPQHLAQAQLRAMEEGLPVIRATPTGISAIIDARGRLLASLPWRSAGSIQGRLPAALSPTPFARMGNAAPLLFAAALAALAFASGRRRG